MIAQHQHPVFGPIKHGKLPPRIDERTLQLKKYLLKKRIHLPVVGSEVSWVTKVPSWPMYLNDQLGDCVAAAAGHMVGQWSFYATGNEVLLTDDQILKTYEDVGGYVPGDPSTDNGMVMLDYLNYWRKTGVGGHKILAYAAVDLTNVDEILSAIELFGNVYLGVALPLSAQPQSAWTVTDGGPGSPNGLAGSWGGHCVPVMAGSPQSRTCITWGARLKMSPNFFLDYADEGYAVISPDWIERNGLSPSDFDLNSLLADLSLKVS